MRSTRSCSSFPSGVLAATSSPRRTIIAVLLGISGFLGRTRTHAPRSRPRRPGVLPSRTACARPPPSRAVCSPTTRRASSRSVSATHRSTLRPCDANCEPSRSHDERRPRGAKHDLRRLSAPPRHQAVPAARLRRSTSSLIAAPLHRGHDDVGVHGRGHLTRLLDQIRLRADHHGRGARQFGIVCPAPHAASPGPASGRSPRDRRSPRGHGSA